MAYNTVAYTYDEVESIACESGHTLHVVHDISPERPSADDSWFHLALWTRDYSGTVDGYDSPEDLISELLECECGLTSSYSERLANEDLARAVERCNKQPGLYVLPVYEYSHSGTMLSVSGFGNTWDSGFVGFVYTTRADLEADGIALITRKDVYKWLESALCMYDNWATGNVYGFILTDADGCEIDSCYGFYPADNYGCIDDNCIDDMLWHCGEKRATSAVA